MAYAEEGRIDDDGGLVLPFPDEFILMDPGVQADSGSNPAAAAPIAAAVDAAALAFGALGEASALRSITGTRFDDDIRGTSRGDVIFARGGDDLVRGRDGDDLIDGGSGRDLIFGGNGRDDIFGGRGRDTLYGGDGRDNFFFDEEDSFDLVRDFRGGDKLVVDGEEGDFAGARFRDIDIFEGRRFDELYVFDDLVARIYGDPVIADDVLLLT